MLRIRLNVQPSIYVPMSASANPRSSAAMESWSREKNASHRIRRLVKLVMVQEPFVPWVNAATATANALRRPSAAIASLIQGNNARILPPWQIAEWV